MDSIKEEITAEMSRTKIDKRALYNLLMKMCEQMGEGGGGPGPRGVPGPQGPQGPPGVCACPTPAAAAPKKASAKKATSTKKASTTAAA